MAPSATSTKEEYNALSVAVTELGLHDHEVSRTKDHGPLLGRRIVGEALKNHIDSIDHDTCGRGLPSAS
jgi:hypothetical protein